MVSRTRARGFRYRSDILVRYFGRAPLIRTTIFRVRITDDINDLYVNINYYPKTKDDCNFSRRAWITWGLF